MRIICFVFALTCLSMMSQSQSQLNYDKIDKDDLKYYVEVLASDSLEGRFTGSTGQKKAADFIASTFAKKGIEPLFDTYLDTFSLHEYAWGEIYIRTEDKTFINQKDISYLGFYNQKTEKEVELVFGGYGTDEDLDQINIKDKMVLLFAENMRTLLMKKIEEKGAYGVIMANPDNDKQFNSIKNSLGYYLLSKRLSDEEKNINKKSFQDFVIKNDQIKSLTGKSIADLQGLVDNKDLQNGPVKTIYVKSERIYQLTGTENVLGIIKGKTEKNIILSAHYDHLGIKGGFVYPGADDNASGVAALFEIAETFKDMDLKYNLIFLATTGEEIGLWGSKYFVNHHSYDSNNVILNINMDMIARSDQDDPNYLYVVGTGLYPKFRPMIDHADSIYSKCKFDFSLEKVSNIPCAYRSSDQYVFHQHGIPALMFHTGLHDDYHRPADKASKINFNVYKKRVVLIAHFLDDIQNTNLE